MGGAGNSERKHTMTSIAHKFRISSLQPTIWRNLSDKGNRYTVKLTRGYKVDDGWRETDNLGFDDLLPAIKLLDQAHSWIMNQVEADRKVRKTAEQAAK